MDSRNLGEHTVHRYDAELEALREMVLRMGGLVEEQLGEALQAIAEADGDRADAVVEGDSRVNDLELEIDEACNSVLALRSPMAGDLRLVIGIIRVVVDLERMGDEAVRIARMAARMASRSGTRRGVMELRHLGPRVQGMLRDALDAFARMDPEAAAMVVEADLNVDREYESLSREMITFMMEDPRAIPRTLDIMFAARALERIGDRACNLSEYVVYVVKGADVRHTSLEELQNAARSDE